jgi:hypothetical protein
VTKDEIIVETVEVKRNYLSILVRDIIAVPRDALRATPGHPSDVRRLRARGTCP